MIKGRNLFGTRGPFVAKKGGEDISDISTKTRPRYSPDINSGKICENHKLRVIINWGGWKSLTKKFEFTQNLDEFERIRAIWENILESFKIIFQIS